MNSQINKIITVFNGISPNLKRKMNQEELKDVANQIEDLKSPNITILICGEFKRGKSSFVNALIGRGVCPVDQDICTAVVSIIRYGEKEKVIRYYGSLDKPKQERIALEDIQKYTVGTADEIKNTIYLEIYLPLERLKDGMTIIDTPGVGGLDPRHAFLTTFFMSQADICLFMTDVDGPMTTTELDFYKEKIGRYSKHSAVILNKTDLKTPDQVKELKEDTTSKISRYCNIKPAEINVIPVSSRMKLDYNKFQETEDLAASNFNAIEQEIERLVYGFRQERLILVRDNLSDMLKRVCEPLRIQLRQIEMPDGNLQAELQNRQAELQRQIRSLNDPSSDFRITLNAKIAEAREEVINHLNEQSILFSKNGLSNLLKRPEAQGQNGSVWVLKNLNGAIQSLGAEVVLELNRAFEQIAMMDEFKGMLQYDAKQFIYELKGAKITGEVPFHKRLMSLAPGVMVFGGTNLVLGGIMGFLGIATGGVVPAIAAVAGGLIAINNFDDTTRNAKIAEFNKEYQPQIAVAMSQLQNYVNTQFTTFQTEWLRVVAKRVSGYQESVTELVGKIKELSLNQHKATQQKLAIEAAIRPIEAQMKMLSEIK